MPPELVELLTDKCPSTEQPVSVAEVYYKGSKIVEWKGMIDPAPVVMAPEIDDSCSLEEK